MNKNIEEIFEEKLTLNELENVAAGTMETAEIPHPRPTRWMDS